MENFLPPLAVIQKKLPDFFLQRPEIIFSYLFGSVATGHTTPMSDIDIAVAIDEALLDPVGYPYGYAAHLTGLLMSVLKTNSIDLVVLNDASPIFKNRILSDGIRIFCRDHARERAFYLHAFRQYQDTAPLRRIQNFYLQRYLKNLGPVRQHGQS